MNKMKRVVALLLSLAMMFVMAPAVLAADAKAGQTVTVSNTLSNIYNANGSFSVSGDDIVESYTVAFSGVSNLTAQAPGGNSVWIVPAGDPTAGSVTINLSVKVKASAQAGQSATITLSGIYGDANGEVGNEQGLSLAFPVTVVATPAGPSGPSGPSTPTSPSTGPKIDYSELEKQIAIAEGLNKADYTAESWAALEAALEAGKAALKSTSQKTVDQAAQDLADAIAALVKMDYSALLAALASVEDWLATEDLSDLWIRLVNAVNRGKELLTSGDQEAVNAVAAEILEILAELKERMAALRNPVVDTDTTPEGEFCNIPMHKVWPILFFVSLVVNVVLIVVPMVKKNKKDTTPLVDYDIGDDA